MTYTMITPWHNHDFGYITLRLLDQPTLPESILVEQQTFWRKSGLHISLLALVDLVPLIRQAGQDVTEQDLVDDFLAYQTTHRLVDFTPTGQLRLVKKGARQSVVLMVDLPEIEGLFSILRQKYGAQLPTQPAHITLYTLQPEAGIGLLSPAELEQYSQPVRLPELENQLAEIVFTV